MIGIFFEFRFLNIFGHISESIKIASLGRQYLMNLFTIYLLSNGKYTCNVFFNLSFLKIFAELVVDVESNILFIFLFFSNFLIIGTILISSPTLAACIQIFLFAFFASNKNSKKEIFEFFDNVKVNQDNDNLKKNRLELINYLCKTFENFTNFQLIKNINE